jgi:8-oxo-dGTP pyrophosphatase MutT (NUDIX family)
MSPPLLRAALEARPRLRLAFSGFAESAVLVLLLVDDDAPTLSSARLLFTVRDEALRTHAGQISFPGGRRERDDPDLAITALREAEEELGIARGRVEVLGFLDDVPTPSSYIITPVVGLVRGALALSPQAGEVAAVFECTIAQLRAPGCYVANGTRTWAGVEYVMHEYHANGRRVWGATARMVHQLLELLP